MFFCTSVIQVYIFRYYDLVLFLKMLLLCSLSLFFFLIHGFLLWGATLVVQTVKSLPTMWETQVRSLGPEDPWKREWQPTPVFLPREFHGQRNLAGYSP